MNDVNEIITALENDGIGVVDRYTALGIPYPDPETVCKGYCEGTGWVPIYLPESDEGYRAAWEAAERESPSKDGCHFVKCLTCGGTGRRAP